MKPYSLEIYQLIARYFTGESSAEEAAKLEGMLENDPVLAKEFELCKSILLDDGNELPGEHDSKDQFKRVSRRLKDEGLM